MIEENKLPVLKEGVAWKMSLEKSSELKKKPRQS